MTPTSVLALIDRAGSWRTGRVRLFAFLLAASFFTHLCISLFSDPLTAAFGIDVVAGTVESNLGGRIGALLDHSSRALWGALYLVVPVSAGYVVARFIWPKSVRAVAADLIWGLSATALLAATIAAAGNATPTPNAAGGVIGGMIRSVLIGPFGVAGALIIPLASLLLLVGVRLERATLRTRIRSTVEYVQTAVAHHVSLWTAKSPLAKDTTRDRSPFLRMPTLPLRPLREKAKRALGGRNQPTEPPARPLPAYLTPTEEVAVDVVDEGASGPMDLARFEPDPTPAAPIETATQPWNVPATLFADKDADAGDEARFQAEIQHMGEQMMTALETYKIGGELLGHTAGARVISYHVRPASGIKVSQFESLEREISLALMQESVRVSPAPRAGAISIEVPHPDPRTVLFSDLYNSDTFARSTAELPMAMGVDLEGQVVIENLAAMPHMLVAGATGSGKSVALNVMLTSLCTRHSPEDLRLILVDPKRVELALYADLPHLRHDVICDAGDVHAALRWAVLEMERRYEVLRQAGMRNLKDYEGWRASWSPDPSDDDNVEHPEKLPYLVIVVDEMADLMMTEHRQQIEHTLIQLAQKARAVGIHLILATQRPDANVFSGLLKANVPVRAAFRVAQAVNSKIILDRNGAERLLGNGDMLYLGPGASDPKRLQGAFISTEETREFVRFCADRWPVPADREEANILEAVRAADAPPTDVFGNAIEERDQMFGDALRVCLANGGASTSLLQRRLRIGYGRAARIIDQMEDSQMIGPENGSRARELLFDEDLLDSLGY